MNYIYRIYYYDKSYSLNSTDVCMSKEDFQKIKPFLSKHYPLMVVQSYRNTYFYETQGVLKPITIELLESRPHYIYREQGFRKIVRPITYDPVRSAKIIRAVRQALPLKEVLKGDQS